MAETTTVERTKSLDKPVHCNHNRVRLDKTNSAGSTCSSSGMSSVSGGSMTYLSPPTPNTAKSSPVTSPGPGSPCASPSKVSRSTSPFNFKARVNKNKSKNKETTNKKLEKQNAQDEFNNGTATICACGAETTQTNKSGRFRDFRRKSKESGFSLSFTKKSCKFFGSSDRNNSSESNSLSPHSKGLSISIRVVRKDGVRELPRLRRLNVNVEDVLYFRWKNANKKKCRHCLNFYEKAR